MMARSPPHSAVPTSAGFWGCRSRCSLIGCRRPFSAGLCLFQRHLTEGGLADELAEQLITTGMSPNTIRLFTHFILSAVFLVAGFSNALADPALKKVTLLLDWYPEAENAGYFYALTHGLYARAGLDVQITPVGPNASVEPQVALGKYDFGLGSSDQVLIARSRGIPLVA